ncbi:MAG: hypothetical protein JWQ85_2537 [Mucilaginibacter sp.]|nr:hypothetical protein [Mucilaginibacter sp.]
MAFLYLNGFYKLQNEFRNVISFAVYPDYGIYIS